MVELPAVTVCNLSPLPATPALDSHPTWGAFLALQETATNPGDFANQADHSHARSETQYKISQ